MFLTVIRHGESHVNVLGNKVDNMDASLTKTGQQQALALGKWFKGNHHHADILYSSSMVRALETTSYLVDALQAEPIQDHRIREIPNVYPSGDIVQPDDMARKYASDWAHKNPFVPRAIDLDGSESWMHFRVRVGQFMNAMIEQHMGKSVYVVAHGGVISAMFDNIFNVGPIRYADVHNYNTSWSRIQYRTTKRERWYLWDHNRIDHLVGTNLI